VEAETIRWVACVLIAIAAAGGGWDFVYLHLWVQKLHARPDTRHEHRLHTWQVALSTPLVIGLFCFDAAGALLWLVVLLFAATLAVEIQDIWCERESRRAMGGLPSAEYALHVLVSGIRLCAVALILIVKPLQYWRFGLTAPELQPPPVLATGAALAAGGALVTVVHIVAARRGGAEHVRHQAFRHR
jgi:hypothetical protein